VPLYVMNVTYPLVDKEFVRFCAGKKAILIVEEGQPDYIEQAVNTILRRADIQTRMHGKDVLPMAGEYTGGVVREGHQEIHRERCGPICCPADAPRRTPRRSSSARTRPRARSPPTCTAGRRRSAPAARSGRSSRR
jgi:indolepyruvate ferredoxin oxidoreductase alpha subunit